MKSLLLALVFLVGCAAGPAVVTGPPVHCFPEGTPANVLSWPIVDARSMLAPDADGVPRTVVLVGYAWQGQTVRIMFVDGLLALVDLAPDTQAPPLVDPGMLDVDKKAIRANGRPTCGWVSAGRTA